MSFPIQSSAMGDSGRTRRDRIVANVSPGCALQTIRNSGGTVFSAWKRSLRDDGILAPFTGVARRGMLISSTSFGCSRSLLPFVRAAP